VRDKIVTRWRRIAAETAGQCRRTFDLVVDDPVRVGDVPVNVAVADLDGDPDWRGVTAVAIGPEGGWAPGEWNDERRRVVLGPTVLRGETAGVLAAALLAFGAGGWGFTIGGQHDG
jgi:16S rRNA U1498 N3-methylase RsmE